MHIKTFIETYGWVRAARVATKAGTTPIYLDQIAKGHRNASFPLAERIVKASKGEIDLLSCVKATPDRRET